MPDENLKHLGAASIVVAFAALLFIVRRWSLGTHATSISKHAGAQRTSYLLFGSVLTFVGAAFYLFLWRWFGPAIGAAWPYYLILALAGIFQLLTAWLPDDGSGKGLAKAHRLVAFSMAAMMMLLVGCVALAPNVGVIARTLSVLVLTLMVILWYLFSFVKSTHRHFLVYQSVYIVSFYVVILLATYTLKAVST